MGLESIVLGSGKFVAAGKEWTYHALDLADRLDYLQRRKKAGEDEDGLEHVLDVLWLAMRKVGKTPRQVEAGEFAIERYEVGRLFGMGDVQQLADIARHIWEISGYRPTPPAPTAGAAKTETSQEPPKTG